MNQYETTDNQMSSGQIREIAQGSIERGKARREHRERRQASRREVMVNRVAVLAVAGAIGLTAGKDIANFVGDIGSKIGDGAAKIGNVLPNTNQAAHDAAASHAPVPTTDAGLERQAQATIDKNHQSQIAAAHHNQQQP